MIPPADSAGGTRPDEASGRREVGSVVALRAQVACLAELAAPNPGNVRPGRDLPGLTAREMMVSAAAIGPALASAGDAPLGRTILTAVEETRRWVDTNTNLGIILLFAPVARAAIRSAAGAAGERDLGAALETVLDGTTVGDAELAYRAIRTAEPGGMGRVAEQDVSGRPTVPLRAAMRLAAERDTVAAQYASGYRLLRTVGVPRLREARREGLDWTAAAHRCFVRLLAERPDSLLARKFGRDEAEAVRAEAAGLLREGAPASGGREEVGSVEALDRRLRSVSPPRNPGTTADLTAAALFLALLDEAGWNDPDAGQ